MSELNLEDMKELLVKLRDSDEFPKPYFVCEHPGVILRLIGEIERLRGELAEMRSDEWSRNEP